MALFNSISADNREVEQGNTYQYEVEPAATNSCLAAAPGEDGGVAIFNKESVYQWHGITHFSKRYKYVGLDKATAESCADSILTAYTIYVNKWCIALKTFGADAVYCYVSAGASVPLVCASVTPVHVEGPVWAIEVDVNATFDYYSTPVKGSASSTPPSASTLKGLAASIANFPEGG